MVESIQVHELPSILLVANREPTPLIERLKESGCVSDSLVWKFDTKYYTADVQLTLWNEQEHDAKNVEAIIFYVEDAGELQEIAPKITQLYEQY